MSSCSCKLWRAFNSWIHFSCCYFQASNCFFKWSNVGMFAFPGSFQGPLKPNRPILKNSAWKLQLHGKPKIKLTFHKEFRTWPNSSHPKENQLKLLFLIPKILIFVSHRTQVLPLPFMNFCEVLFFPFSCWISVELSSLLSEYTVTEMISDTPGMHSQILTSLWRKKGQKR